MYEQEHWVSPLQCTLSAKLSSSCESILKEIEKGKVLGRDKLPVFKTWCSSESASVLYIRTGCNVLGPREDEKCGCRDMWEDFCNLKKIKSHITSYRGNWFNHLFSRLCDATFQSAGGYRLLWKLHVEDQPETTKCVGRWQMYGVRMSTIWWLLLVFFSTQSLFHTGSLWRVTYIIWISINMWEEWESLSMLSTDASSLLDVNQAPLFSDFPIQNEVFLS